MAGCIKAHIFVLLVLIKQDLALEKGIHNSMSISLKKFGIYTALLLN